MSYDVAPSVNKRAGRWHDFSEFVPWSRRNPEYDRPSLYALSAPILSPLSRRIYSARGMQSGAAGKFALRRTDVLYLLCLVLSFRSDRLLLSLATTEVSIKLGAVTEHARRRRRSLDHENRHKPA